MTKGIFSGAIPGAPGPGNVEAKLREMQAACAAACTNGGMVRWPDWMDGDSRGLVFSLTSFFQEAADELEQRSLYAGNLLRRLAGD